MKTTINRTKKILALVLCLSMLFASLTIPAFADDADTLQHSRIEVLPDGGKIYVYVIDGVENMFPVPPKGFHPLTASDEDLETYGFPPRPSDPDELEKWAESMSVWKETPIPKIEQSEQTHWFMQPAISAEISPMAVTRTSNSYNWSGYVATGGKNAFAHVQGDFVQPSINATCKNNAYESTWIGLGGNAGSSSLVQTGTAMNTKNGGRHYYAWYEYLSASHPNPEIVLTKVTIRPGDKIHCYCSFNRTSNKFNAYVANNTNGTSQSVIVNISASEYYDGRSAEFINERPTLTNGVSSWYAPLTKYSTTKWTNCRVFPTEGAWTDLGSLSTTKVTMVYNGHTLALPSGLSGRTFTSTWKNYN